MSPPGGDHIDMMAFSGGSFTLHIGFGLARLCGVLQDITGNFMGRRRSVAYRSNVIQRGHNHAFWACAASVCLSFDGIALGAPSVWFV